MLLKKIIKIKLNRLKYKIMILILHQIINQNRKKINFHLNLFHLIHQIFWIHLNMNKYLKKKNLIIKTKNKIYSQTINLLIFQKLKLI